MLSWDFPVVEKDFRRKYNIYIKDFNKVLKWDMQNLNSKRELKELPQGS